MRRAAVVATLALCTIVTIAVPAAEAGTRPPTTSEIEWRPCTPEEIDFPDDFRERLECADVVVPVDYEEPDGRTLSLFVSRRPAKASPSLGPLFMNQGGPGMEAAQAAPAALDGIPALDRFDIIGMDPRGTGRSTKLECAVDIRRLPDVDTNARGELGDRYARALRRYVDGCARDPNLRFFGSNTVARDMDHIRELLGAPQITYFGKSYGSDLGTAYLALFPDKVRAAVLDGATDLTLDAVDFVAQQARASRNAFDRYLEHCRVDGCAWAQGDDPATAWEQLLQRFAEDPLEDRKGNRVDDARLRDFQHEAWQLDDMSVDAAIDALVLDGDAGDFVAKDLSDEDAAIARAFIATTCLDIPVDEFGAAYRRLRDAVGAPNPDLVNELALCAAWPKPADPIEVRRLPDGAPVMVVSTRGDVPTPYESGMGLARALAVPVLTFDAGGHTAYLSSECVREIANRLLVSLQNLPPDGSTCADDRFAVPSASALPPDLAEL